MIIQVSHSGSKNHCITKVPAPNGNPEPPAGDVTHLVMGWDGFIHPLADVDQLG